MPANNREGHRLTRVTNGAVRIEFAITLRDGACVVPSFKCKKQCIEKSQLSLAERRVEQGLVPVPGIAPNLFPFLVLTPEQFDETAIGLVEIAGNRHPPDRFAFLGTQLVEVLGDSRRGKGAVNRDRLDLGDEAAESLVQREDQPY